MVRIGQWCVRGVIVCAGVVAVGCGGSGLGRGTAASGGGPGSGGAPGAGGGMETGGVPGAGGAPDSGAGGAMGGGGITGAGGVIGSGGALETGGMTGAGGDPNCHTSVTGTVYDPAGSVPLSNVLVYVPSATPPAMTEGISCASSLCQSFVPPPAFAAALSDDSGHFTLDGVPPGSNVPLVIEIGKWRRQVVIPSVTACAATPLTDPELTRLPRNQIEGHLPRIALVTGHASPAECLLRTIGIADSEFTNDAGNGRVNL